MIPTLVEYIRIPNKSPAFDKDWEAHGHMDKAVDLLVAWANASCRTCPDRRWRWCACPAARR